MRGASRALPPAHFRNGFAIARFCGRRRSRDSRAAGTLTTKNAKTAERLVGGSRPSRQTLSYCLYSSTTPAGRSWASLGVFATVAHAAALAEKVPRAIERDLQFTHAVPVATLDSCPLRGAG